MAEAKPKLNDYQKNLIIKLLGAYFTVQETVDVLRDKYEVELTYQAVYWYWRNRNDEILLARKHFDLKIDVIPITNKINRLKERQMLIDDLKKHLWYEKPLLRNGNPVADDDGNPILLKLTGNHESINKVLDSAQKELEPSKVEHSGSIATPVVLNRVTNFLTLIKESDPKAYEAFVKVTTDNGVMVKPKQIPGKKKE